MCMFSTTSDYFHFIIVLHLKTMILQNRKYFDFFKEHHSFFFLQVATVDVIKSMHGSQPCLNPDLHKEQPYLHPRLVKACSVLFFNCDQKKGNVSPSFTSPPYNREKAQNKAAPLFFFFLICICNTQEKPFKGEGLFACSRAQEVEEQT